METALVIGEAIITSSANALGKPDEKMPNTASWLTSKTKIALIADARVKGTQTNADVVSLSGTAQHVLISAQASWTAWQVPSVKSAKNDLTVKEKAEGRGHARSC